LRIRVTSLAGDPAARRLVGALDRELGARYGPGEGVRYDPSLFAPPHGTFLVIESEGMPVACAGILPLSPGVAELKRMYVVPERRGTGLARRLLAELEEAARALGYRELHLMTGTAQPEAMVLYESAGYERVPNFGQYRDSASVRCYGKRISE
jgi:GNAT superfamily N-acetyltransferase